MKPDKSSVDVETDEFVSAAYGLQNTADTQQFYQRWASDYDQHMVTKLGYRSPRLVARNLTHHLRDVDAEILDIGCGTGLTSEYLHETGFRRIDGIDLTDEMLKKSRERGIYRHLFKADLNKPIDLPDRSYDALLSSGTFTRGHVGPEPFDELARLMRPGGFFSFSVHVDIWESGGFSEAIARLTREGVFVVLEQKQDIFFESQEPTGIYLVCGRP